ncbi:alginate biosynthesis protein AlgP [Deinococcus taeanensis]|uniref:alginate biosynthesis protein AlgP n=1 Tax=Deinococcus taeanensis TaxID=2737050 RepID=UPI001CDC3FA4|nr:alginate biosynthesis protein AlgP [Deinococcus taeanensis]UBV43660.1 alginate biosynthesis protein AlgP [Deinococcus taeanensis]
MTNETTGGVSKRSLLMLGGLAAVALNADTRRALVNSSRSAWSGAQDALGDTVKPALLSAAAQAQHMAQQAAHAGTETVTHTATTLREEGVPRVSALLGEVLQAAGGVAHLAQEKAQVVAGEAQTYASLGSKQAAQLARTARTAAGSTLGDAQGAGTELLASVHDRVSSALHEAADGHEARRRRAERTLRQARREAERELRSGRRTLQGRQLEKAVSKKVAPLEKQMLRELKQIDRQVRLARRDDRSGSGLGGAVAPVVLLGVGAVVLARVPAARQGILNAVESLSPDAAQSLRTAGRNARNLIGSAWLERIEEPHPAPAPGAAGKTQAGTTGGTWGGSPAPDSPAAAKSSGDAARPSEKAAEKPSGPKNN